MGWNYLICMLLPLVLVSLDSTCATDFNLLFDCRILGLGCENGGTCSSEDGSCTCTGNYVGSHDCGYDSTSTACTTNKCENGGTCYTSGGVDICYCASGFSGDTCQNRRLDLTCLTTSMTVRFEPYGDDVSQVEINGEGSTTCSVTKQAGSVWSETITNDNCGMESTTNDVAKEKTRVLTFRLQYYKTIEANIDVQAKFTCTELTDGGQTEATVEITNPPAGSASTRVVGDLSNTVPTGVTIELLNHKDGAALDPATAYPIGTEVRLVISLDTSNYDYLLVTSVISETLPLIFSSCLAKYASNVLISLAPSTETTDGVIYKRVTLAFKLFRELTLSTSVLSLDIKLKVCNVEATCQATCTGVSSAYTKYSPNNLGRRRRAADEDGKTEDGTATVSVNIAPNPFSNQFGASQVIKTTECVTTVGFLVPLVLLLVLLIVAIAAACFFCMRASRLASDMDKMMGRPHRP